MYKEINQMRKFHTADKIAKQVHLDLDSIRNIITVQEVYEDSENKEEAIRCLAEDFDMREDQVRFILKESGIYKSVSGPTRKEQYARALWAITGVEEKQFMKMSLKALEELMERIKEFAALANGGNSR